jgi:hypothetical protein
MQKRLKGVSRTSPLGSADGPSRRFATPLPQGSRRRACGQLIHLQWFALRTQWRAPAQPTRRARSDSHVKVPGRPQGDSIAGVYGYSRQKPFHQLGATDTCYSRDELVTSIRRTLLDIQGKAPNRRAMVNRYLVGYATSIDRIREVSTSLASERLMTLS